LRIAQSFAQSNGIGQVFFKGDLTNPAEHGQFMKKIV
jgi:hypothetical protein